MTKKKMLEERWEIFRWATECLNSDKNFWNENLNFDIEKETPEFTTKEWEKLKRFEKIKKQSPTA